MKYKPTKRGVAAVILIACGWVLMSWIEALPAGQQCTWVSDCGFNETCRTVPFSQRGPNDQPGICVPKSWGE